jgi:ribosome modulation factor
MFRTAFERDSKGDLPLGVIVIGRDGRTHTVQSHQTPSRPSVSWWQSFLWRHPRLHESASEIRSCYQRILLLCKRGRATFVSTGRVFLEVDQQGRHLNTTSQGRKRSIERLLSVCPWVSLQDRQFFLSGWEMGREWALRNLGAPGEEPIGYSYSSEILLAELGGNSMPAKQFSKRPNVIRQPLFHRGITGRKT